MPRTPVEHIPYAPVGPLRQAERSGDSLVFRLWSPDAEAVRVNLYHGCADPAPHSRIRMEADAATGIWSAWVPGPPDVLWYTFQIYQEGNWLEETPGAWAVATGTNGRRAAVLDLAETNPQGWKHDKGPLLKNPVDAVVCELHLRDFSVHDSSGMPHKGKFLSLASPGTRSPQGLTTGIDHLKELGVTHVHLLPLSDFDSVDELDTQPAYNWGYDPQNMNVPEGSYSTDPSDPAVRIRELKTMVMALHSAGIGVIMDVVYNHVSNVGTSPFHLSAPGCYFRTLPGGTLSNGSGCGNETASERPWMSDFIVESVKFWAEEYHVDGFRFDLMAIHDIPTMNRVALVLKGLNPSALIYGEGWNAGPSPLPPPQRASKQNVSRLKHVAVFSDDFRDTLRGDWPDPRARGFLAARAGLEEALKCAIAACTHHPQVDCSRTRKSKIPWASSPSMTVNYVSCHDDLCLADKLHASNPGLPGERIKAMARLAHAVTFTSQGMPFMMAGEEFMRTKQGVRDSYRSHDAVNAIDWTLKAAHSDLFEYVCGLMALRRAHPAFRMTSALQTARHLVFDDIDPCIQPGVVAYSLRDHANGDPWREIKVIFNGSDATRVMTVDPSPWLIVAREADIDPEKGLGTLCGGLAEVAPCSALILARP